MSIFLHAPKTTTKKRKFEEKEEKFRQMNCTDFNNPLNNQTKIPF